jgi:subtilisin family serine protease
MRKAIIIFGILLVMSAFLQAVAVRDSGAARPLYAPDLIKVKLTAPAISRAALPQGLYAEAQSFGINELDQLMARSGGYKVIRAHRRVKDSAWEEKTGFDRWFLIQLDGSVSVENALKTFRANRYIETAIPEYYAYTTVTTPNDTYFPNNWGHNNTAQLPVYVSGSGHTGAGVGTIGFDSDAKLAWDQGYGSASIIIAIIDTGVDTAHPDLRLVAGYDYGDNDSNPMDDSADPGHGTACSGVAAGIANNNLGVTGIAGGCSVMPLKIASSDGSLGFTAIENALTHAGDNNVDVASMSFGAEGGTAEGDIPSTDTALEYAYSHGVTLLAATANSNASTIAYPSNHNKVISVGAASPTGERKSPTSSDGETWWGSNYGTAVQDAKEAVDVMAPTILPATDITGTGNGYDTSSDYYLWFNGTSCATPYAAGVAALIISKTPSLTPAQVRAKMISGCTDMTVDGGAGWDRYTGYGMVNANASLNEPPAISWSPASFSQTLAPDATASQNLSVGNTGGIALTYTASKPQSSTLYFSESFENGGSIPAGWTQEYVNYSLSWVFATGGYNGTNPSSAQDGTYNARLFYNSSSQARITKLVTPAINLSGATAPVLTFFHTQAYWAGDQDQLKVYYRTSSGGTWTQLAHYTTSITTWTLETISLPNPGATYYIAFEGITDYGYGVCVDNVRISQANPGVTWFDLNGAETVSGSVPAAPSTPALIPVNFNSAGLATGTYTSSFLLTSNSFSNPSITIPVTLVVEDPTQNISIPLVSGWNIVSSWVLPPNLSLTDVFAGLISAGYLVKVQDENGSALVQDINGDWQNGIGDLEADEGYYVQVNADCTLEVMGEAASLPMTVSLASGWNIISSPYGSPQSAMTLLEPLMIAGQLVKVQDESGNSIVQDINGDWVDGIGNFEPGEGYYINVNAATSLTFPLPAKAADTQQVIRKVLR